MGPRPKGAVPASVHYRRLFPNAILAGWFGRGPNEGRDYVADWLGRAVATFARPGDTPEQTADRFSAALRTNQRAVVAALMAAGLAMLRQGALPSKLAIYDPVAGGTWILWEFEGTPAQVKKAINWHRGRPVPSYVKPALREPVRAGGRQWIWILKK